MLAEAKGIEPLSTGLEPVILPLYYTSILQHAQLISTYRNEKNFAVGVLKLQYTKVIIPKILFLIVCCSCISYINIILKILYFVNIWS